jgi:hypothetical protein
MTRPLFEVADVIHKVKKVKSFKPFFESLTWEQIKVLRAIVRCRTSALGGHRDRCKDCGYTVAISYNSCIMGSIWLWGVPGEKEEFGGLFDAFGVRFCSP